jgi:hypothetical protein
MESSGCGAAWLARLLGVQEVPGSNPGSPTKKSPECSGKSSPFAARDNQSAMAAMQARLQPGAHFLWLDDEPNRAEELLRADIHTKGLYIAPVSRDIPRKVPHGLIHDWLGVGFIPNAKIEDVLLVVRSCE